MVGGPGVRATHGPAVTDPFTYLISVAGLLALAAGATGFWLEGRLR